MSPSLDPPGQLPKNMQGLQPKRPQGVGMTKLGSLQPGPKPRPIQPQPQPKSLHFGFFSLGYEVGLGTGPSALSLSLGESLSLFLSHFLGTQGQIGRFKARNF
jgi:hypothetical protein